MIKSLVVGSVAGLIAVGGAQAADLPLKTKAVEDVRICSPYGAGFYYITGTDTCIKLGGFLRADVLVNSNSVDTGNVNGPAGAQNRFTNAYTWRGRGTLTLDTRTSTEYGVVRTFSEERFNWTDDSYTGTRTGGTVYSQLGVTGASAPNNANAGAVAGRTFSNSYIGPYLKNAGSAFNRGAIIAGANARKVAWIAQSVFNQPVRRINVLLRGMKHDMGEQPAWSTRGL